MSKNPYVRTFSTFGTDVRAALDLDAGVNMGAFRKKGSDKWEAFATFGRKALNEGGFDTERDALNRAEKWVREVAENIVSANIAATVGRLGEE